MLDPSVSASVSAHLQTAPAPSPPLDLSVRRQWLGNAFCQTLLPTVASLTPQLERAEQPATLSLPPLTDEGLVRLEPVLTLLQRRAPDAEVVVNDWGALRVVTKAGLTPVLGRLLTRILRDPRLPATLLPLPERTTPEQTSQPHEPPSPYARLLQQYGIRWIEVDYVPQAAQIPYAALGVRPILTFPYVFVATGRICPFAGLHQPRELKFSVPPLCRQECRKYEASLVDPVEGFRGPLLSFGNTIFSQLDSAQVEAGLAWAEAMQARVVLRARPFDELGLEPQRPLEAAPWLQAHGHLIPGESV